MIKIYLKIGESDTAHKLITTDPVEAEAHYLQLCQTRTPGAGGVIVKGADMIASGYYRTDASWHGSNREQDPIRHGQVWALPAEQSGPPTTAQIRGAAKAAGLSGLAAGRVLGVDGRSWRYWCQGPDAGGRKMARTTWFTFLVLTGLYPEFRRV